MTLAVLITYYNEGRYLTECLESLAASVRQPDEILVYDDASDRPAEQWIPDGMPVRIIRAAINKGPSHGRNLLLRECSSTHVHFHDADDLFAPGWSDAVGGMIEAGDLDAVFTAVGRTDGDALASDPGELTPDADLVRYCLSHAPLPAGGTYRREIAIRAGGYSERYWQSEDYDFHIRLAALGPRFGVIPKPLALRRAHASNRSRDRVAVWTDATRILEDLADQLAPAYTQDVCDALARIGRNLFQMGAPSEARRAFASAQRLGHPDFPSEARGYRFVARCCGPMWAEKIGRAYRALLPGDLRGRLRRT